MHRRAYVAATASMLAPLAGGCLGVGANEDSNHDWTTVYYTEAGAIVDGGLDLGDSPESARYLFGFASESAASAAINVDVLRELGGSEAVSFLEDVDFEREVLLVHQEYPVKDAPQRNVTYSVYDDEDREVQVHIAAKGLLQVGSDAAETMLITKRFQVDVTPERAIVSDADGETIATTVE